MKYHTAEERREAIREYQRKYQSKLRKDPEHRKKIKAWSDKSYRNYKNLIAIGREAVRRCDGVSLNLTGELADRAAKLEAEMLEMREIIGDISGELKALKNQIKWGTKK